MLKNSLLEVNWVVFFLFAFQVLARVARALTLGEIDLDALQRAPLWFCRF